MPLKRLSAVDMTVEDEMTEFVADDGSKFIIIQHRNKLAGEINITGWPRHRGGLVILQNVYAKRPGNGRMKSIRNLAGTCSFKPLCDPTQATNPRGRGLTRSARGRAAAEQSQCENQRNSNPHHPKH